MRAPKIISEFMLKPTPFDKYANRIISDYYEENGIPCRIAYNGTFKSKASKLIKSMFDLMSSMNRNYQ